jgi:hypothetical protein
MQRTYRAIPVDSLGCDSGWDDPDCWPLTGRIDQVQRQCSLWRPDSGRRLLMRRKRHRRVSGPRPDLPVPGPLLHQNHGHRRPVPGGAPDGHCPPELRHEGVGADCRDPSPLFGPGQIETLDLRNRQLSIVGNSGVARPGLVIRSRSSQIGTPTDSPGAL